MSLSLSNNLKYGLFLGEDTNSDEIFLRWVILCVCVAAGLMSAGAIFTLGWTLGVSLALTVAIGFFGGAWVERKAYSERIRQGKIAWLAGQGLDRYKALALLIGIGLGLVAFAETMALMGLTAALILSPLFVLAAVGYTLFRYVQVKDQMRWSFLPEQLEKLKALLTFANNRWRWAKIIAASVAILLVVAVGVISGAGLAMAFTGIGKVLFGSVIANYALLPLTIPAASFTCSLCLQKSMDMAQRLRQLSLAGESFIDTLFLVTHCIAEGAVAALGGGSESMQYLMGACRGISKFMLDFTLMRENVVPENTTAVPNFHSSHSVHQGKVVDLLAEPVGQLSFCYPRRVSAENNMARNEPGRLGRMLCCFG